MSNALDDPPSRRCVTPAILRSIAFSVWRKRGRLLRHPHSSR